MNNTLSRKPWTAEAICLLNEIKQVSSNHSMMVLLRHSHRKEYTSFAENHKAQLTEEGKIAAYEFGRELPSNRTYRIFHSIHPRCIETAKQIENGLKVNNIQVSIIGSLEVLWGMAGDYPAIVKLALQDGQHIVTKWAAGHYPNTIIEPFTSYIQRAANVLWSYHKEAPPKGIDIFITHDFHIMALQFGWTGVQNCNGWVNFLGGFIVILKEKHNVLINKDLRLEIPHPYWWPTSETERTIRELPDVMEKWFPKQMDE